MELGELIGYVVIETVPDLRGDVPGTGYDLPLGGDVLYELDDRESAEQAAAAIGGFVAEVRKL